MTPNWPAKNELSIGYSDQGEEIIESLPVSMDIEMKCKISVYFLLRGKHQGDFH